ncbi:MAG: TIGR01777 family oxidoreductase [Bacteroidota bacterium]
MKKIVLTGATGFIGKKIAIKLIECGCELTIFTRSVKKAKQFIPNASEYVEWNSNFIDWKTYLEGKDAVIHLAGENVMAKRWSEEQKKKIRSSRVDSTRALVNTIGTLNNKPKVFVCASAIGYYGNSEHPEREDSNAGNDFLAGVVKAWEDEAGKVEQFGVRRISMRIGIVLDKNGGALARMIIPFKFFIGGAVGSGKQWVSWIHIEDLINIFLFALENENLEGAVNCVSPNPVTMNQFAKTIGKILKRPSFLRIPEFLLRLILGEASSVVTGGSKVSSSKIISCGFKFKYNYIEEALRNLL